ncbi:MAG: DUF378 domain-containing protein [Parcubacteria group bacterium]|nr:DUF378 domain-containing protein [Parcubacteria group bacterium]
MKSVHMLTFLLLIIGGLNWLAVGVWGWSISSLLGGDSSMLTRVVYILVGLSAVVEIISHKGKCKECVM